jgi:hypothetical protein
MAVPLFAPALSIPAPSLDWNAMLNNPSALARLLRKREVLGFGAFGVVYEVEGAAIKIGCVDGNEPIVQQWVYETLGLALPVWASQQEVILPRVVTREACPRHGYPSDLWTPTSVNCHCDESLAALVMPVAESPDLLDVADHGDDIFEAVYNAVQNKFGICLDVHQRNMLSLDGRLLVCDFGDVNSRSVELW